MNSEWIEVTISNWADFNPRADRGGFAWFRMDNQFYLHMRQRKGASADATILMAFLLAECSAANGKPFKLRPAFASELLGRPEKKIRQALLELESLADCVLKPLQAATSQTDGRTDETDRTDETERDETDLSSPSAPTAPAVPRLARIWNENCGTLSKVRNCSSQRRRSAEARWKENSDEGYWTEVIRRLVASPFCTGKNKSGWRADFDFLIKPDTHSRVLEGKYDARPGLAAVPAGSHQRTGDLDSEITDLLEGMNHGTS